jgi:hypothetical protein
LLISSIEERKVAIAVYEKLYENVRSSPEANFQKVSAYIQASGEAVKSFTTDFSGLGGNISKVIMGLIMVFSRARTVSALRAEGILNIIMKPEEMGKPVGNNNNNNKFVYALASVPDVYNWIVFGLLPFPDVWAMPGIGDGVLKGALSEGFMMPLARGLSIQLHNDYELALSNYKGKALKGADFKKIIKDSLTEAVNRGPANIKNAESI